MLKRGKRVAESKYWCIALLIQMSISRPCFAAVSQEITVGLPSVSYTKTTISRKYSGNGPYGFAGEYGLFVNPRLSLAGQFELNLESSERTAILIGGSGGLKFFLLGGQVKTLSETYVKGVSWPRLNVFVMAGFGAKQFDFSVPEKLSQPQEGSSILVERDGKDLQKGSALGLNLGSGLTFPVLGGEQVGLRAQYFQSFTAENQPTITAMSVWLSVGFHL